MSFGKAQSFEVSGQIMAGPMQLGMNPTIQASPTYSADFAPSQPQPTIAGPAI